MSSTTITRTDALRVAELDRYGVLGEPQRQDLLALVVLAAQVVGVPMATINLITDAEQVQTRSSSARC